MLIQEDSESESVLSYTVKPHLQREREVQGRVCWRMGKEWIDRSEDRSKDKWMEELIEIDNK